MCEQTQLSPRKLRISQRACRVQSSLRAEFWFRRSKSVGYPQSRRFKRSKFGWAVLREMFAEYTAKKQVFRGKKRKLTREKKQFFRGGNVN